MRIRLNHLKFIVFSISLTFSTLTASETKELTVVGLEYKHTNIWIQYILNKSGKVRCGIYHKNSLLFMTELATDKPPIGSALVPRRVIQEWKVNYLRKDLTGRCWIYSD